MSVNVDSTPVSSASSGSVASSETAPANDGGAVDSDGAVPSRSELAADPLNDADRAVENAIAIAPRWEPAPSTPRNPTERGKFTNRPPLDGTEKSKRADEAPVEKHPSNGTLFHDDARKKAARAYAEYVYPIYDFHKLAKNTKFLTDIHDDAFDFSAERGKFTNRPPLDGTEKSKRADEAPVEKHPLNGTLFHDNARKKAARAYADYVHPIYDFHKLAKNTKFLTDIHDDAFDFSAPPDPYSPSMLFEGDDDCKARCRKPPDMSIPKIKLDRTPIEEMMSSMHGTMLREAKLL